MKGTENFLTNFFCVLILLKVHSITKNCVPFYGGFWHPSTGCWRTKKCRKVIQIVNVMNLKEWCIVTSTLCVWENITPLQLISTSVQETLKKSIKSLNSLFDIYQKIKNSNVSFIIATCDVKRTRFLNIICLKHLVDGMTSFPVSFPRVLGPLMSFFLLWWNGHSLFFLLNVVIYAKLNIDNKTQKTLNRGINNSIPIVHKTATHNKECPRRATL